MYDNEDNNKSSLNLYMEAEKSYQEWVSKVKAHQIMHEKQSLKGWRHDNFENSKESYYFS